MEKYVYIKSSIPKHFVDFPEPLSPEEYNNLGETWTDYLNNLWVLLSDEQVAFYESHPTASVKEVWDMQLTPPPVRTLEQAKAEKIAEIEAYDESEAVNSFTIGNQTMWLTREDRTQIDESIAAYESMGATQMTKYFGGVPFTFPLTAWKQMLAALIVYASEALNVTEAHKTAVNALGTIEAVDAFDITADYPDKLSFNV